MLRFANVGNNLTKIIVPGNGDCFYHALMIAIIYDVLTGRLRDNSPTAARIQSVLLPEIAKQLILRGKPAFDFSCVSLKQAIMELMRTVPISELGISQRSEVILPLDDADSQEVKVIKSCDLYHLLIDICAPAMRCVMLNGMEEYNADLKPVVKELFKNEFSSFIKVEHADELDVDSSMLAAAKNYLSGGELYGVDDRFRMPLCNSWHRSFAAILPLFEVNNDSDASINSIFESWWKLNCNQVWDVYKSMHARSRINAGRPQQTALSFKLFCDFNVLNSSNDHISSLISSADQRHSFVFCTRLSHVDAIICGDTNNMIVTALRQRMESFEKYREVMSSHPYPWAQGMSVNESQIEPVVYIAVNNTTGCNVLFSTLIHGIGLWRPTNYMRAVSGSTPDESAASAAASSAPRPTFSHQMEDVD